MKDLEEKNVQDAECDRCRTGLILRDQRGQVLGKVKKPTRIRTNSPSVHEALHLKCQCKAGEHVKMEGRSKELKRMQNYESGFTEKAADAIYQDMVRRWRNEETLKIFMMDEMDEMEIEESKNEEKVVSLGEKENDEDTREESSPDREQAPQATWPSGQRQIGEGLEGCKVSRRSDFLCSKVQV